METKVNCSMFLDKNVIVLVCIILLEILNFKFGKCLREEFFKIVNIMHNRTKAYG